MTASIGVGAPHLALFHICTHAFFKALLFLCSGRIIHKAKNEQDLRKMGKFSVLLPFTTKAIIIGSLALSGIPFLAGFYSKDLILEHIKVKATKRVAVLLSLVATLMTSLYRARLITYLKAPKGQISPINPITEDLNKIISPFSRLILGAILVGWLASIILFNTAPLVMTRLTKSTPFLLTIRGLILILNSMFYIKAAPAKSFQLFSAT